MYVAAPNIGRVYQRNTFSMGLMIALSSWALVFFTLVWGYMVYRLRSESWMGNQVTVQAVLVAALNTVVIAVSTWTLFKAFKDNVVHPKRWVWGTFVLGLMFLMGQLCLWQMVLCTGLHWKTSIAGSFFFLLTGFHALHIAGALVAVLMLGLRFDEWQGSTLSIGIKHFWDFLLIVWMIMFVLIFIIQ